MANLNDLWKNMDPARKRRLVLTAILISLIAGASVAYSFKDKAKPLLTLKNQQEEIILDPKVLEKSMVKNTKKAVRDQNETIFALQKEIEAIKGQKINLKSTLNTGPVAPGRKPFSIPEPPKPLPKLPLRPAKPAIPIIEEVIGAISVVSNPFLEEFVQANTSAKKKEPQSIYLPPSFMEATLLTGLDAETVASANGEPEPVLLRIKDLAILPNQIKANLKGCFVIAHGFGKLTKEAVVLRLITLSCLAKNGQSVIDQPIKGWVAGASSKNGVKGKVVHKFGKSVAFAAIAGLFGGAGDALSASARTTGVSPLGSTQVIDTDKIEKAAIGGGLSSGSKEIAKLYLELARQTTPVIEMLPGQTVTIIISEGVTLEIKETCKGDTLCAL